MTHIAPVSVRGTEAGRRQLNDEDRANIEFYLGAVWNEKSHQWGCEWNPEVPFDRLAYEIYSDQLDRRIGLDRGDEILFITAFECLLAALEAKEARVTIRKLHHKLLQIAKENKLSPDIVQHIKECRPVMNPEGVFPAKTAGAPPEKKRKAKHG